MQIKKKNARKMRKKFGKRREKLLIDRLKPASHRK
jgi:hypothetical protein